MKGIPTLCLRAFNSKLKKTFDLRQYIELYRFLEESSHSDVSSSSDVKQLLGVYITC